MKRILLFGASLAAIASLAGVATPAARAYGNTAQYQVAVSLNCDNRSSFFCTNVVQIGGEWAWYAFNNDSTFDATLTFCAHGQGFNGAFHQNVDGIWKIDTTSQPIFPAATTQTFWTSTDNGVTWSDTQIPAAPSHYSFKPAPGISAEAQVTLIPGR